MIHTSRASVIHTSRASVQLTDLHFLLAFWLTCVFDSELGGRAGWSSNSLVSFPSVVYAFKCRGKSNSMTERELHKHFTLLKKNLYNFLACFWLKTFTATKLLRFFSSVAASYILLSKGKRNGSLNTCFLLFNAELGNAESNRAENYSERTSRTLVSSIFFFPCV